MSHINVYAVAIIVALCAASFSSGVLGHAGHFHVYPDTPTGRNYLRQSIGTCNTWQPTTDATTAGLTISGNTQLFIYYYQNCTERISTSFEMEVTIQENSNLYLNKTFNGYAETGTCEAPGTAPTSYYTNVGTNTSDSNNLLFFKNFRTNDTTGKIWGNAANSFVVRTGSAADTWKSIVLYSQDLGGAKAFCCNVDITQTPAAAVAALAQNPDRKFCSLPPPGMMPPPPSGSATSNRMSVISFLLSAIMGLLAVLGCCL